MQKNMQEHIEQLFRGASLLACGGGLKYSEQKKSLASLKRSKKLHTLSLMPASQLKNTDLCITVGEVGAAGAPPLDKSVIKSAFAEFCSQTGKKPVAIVPPEVGQESIVLEVAAELGLPIIDTDMAGCRAVPRLTDLAMVVQNPEYTFSPLVVQTAKGECQFIPKQKTLELDEQAVRSVIPESEVVVMLGGGISGKQIKEMLDYSSYTTAIELGAAMEQGKQKSKNLAQNMPALLPTKCLLEPVLCKVTQSTETEKGGFLHNEVVLVSVETGQTFNLMVENEYMELTCEKTKTTSKTKYSFPQLIMLANESLNLGIHSSELKVGLTVTLLVADSFAFWKKTKDTGKTQ